MKYQEEIKDYFAAHRQELVEDVCRQVRIRSVMGEAKPGMPYGEEPAAALADAAELAKAYGFAVKNYDNHVIAIDLNDQETELAILAHLDVVPEGTGWTVCDPYQPVVQNGNLYGRGTADDKGPAIASLYALRAMKELGIPLKKNVRLILGSNEENGSKDLAHYFTIETAPPMSFSPDADYPVINIEKGGLHSPFTAQWEESKTLPRVVALEGGHTSNIVPQEAFALIEEMEENVAAPICQAAQERTGTTFTLFKEGNLLRIDVLGQSAHASTPLKGSNAVLALCEAVAALPLAESDSANAVRAMARLFPHADCRGKAIGVAMVDDLSGELTLNIGIVKMDLTSFYGMIDSRVPICGTQENMAEVVKKNLAESGFHLEKDAMNPPHHTPADSPLVKTLLDIYETYTGLEKKCIAIGGGTYVHHIEGGVAFGCTLPGVDNHMHGPDEFIAVDDLVLSAEMFAQSIVELCS